MDLQIFADAAVLASELSQKNEDDSIEENEVISCFTGLKLFYYEHNYSQNSSSLFQSSEECDRISSDLEVTVPEELKAEVSVSKNSQEPLSEKDRVGFENENTENVSVSVEAVQNVTTPSPRRRSQRKHNIPDKSTNHVEIVDDGANSAVLDSSHLKPIQNIPDEHNTETKSTPEKSCATSPSKKTKFGKKEAKTSKDISPTKPLQKNVLPRSSKLKKNAVHDAGDIKDQESCLKNKKTNEKNKVNVSKSKLVKSDSNVTVLQGRKKRTHSESSPDDLVDPISPKIETKSPGKKKVLRSLTKSKSLVKQTKEIETGDVSPKSNKRKRSISSSTKEEKNTDKNSEILCKGKRKKSVSISEEIPFVEDIKPEKKDSTSEIKEPEFKGPSFPCAVVKPSKQKKAVRRESLRTIINDDEPPLFSQPDVLVKVKSDDLSTKKEEKEMDKSQALVDISGNIKQNVSETLASVELPSPSLSKKNQDIKAAEAIPHVDFEDETKNEENQTSSVFSFKNASVADFDVKDIDSENSLHIDESFGPNDETSDENNVDSRAESSKKIHTVPKNMNSKQLRCDEFQESDEKDSEKMDVGKSIAERKPRRNIKKKEFFEDITTRNEVTKKSGRQKENEKKSQKEEEKKGKKSSKQVDDDNSDDSEEEDDPEKLWCICRQPHNDRFMIQCDVCEDWFHGSCVGVTRQLGRKLEKQKKEWKCPNCISNDSLEKKVESPKVEKATEKTLETHGKQVKATPEKTTDKKHLIGSASILKKEKMAKSVKAVTTSYSSAVSVPVSNPVQTVSTIKKSPLKIIRQNNKELLSNTNTKKTLTIIKKKLNCVTCQAPAVNGSYCSEKCIEKHASDCVSIMRESLKGSLKASEFDSQKVVVLDTVKGNVIAGDNAPTAGEIVSWLKVNPSYMIACPSNPETSSKKDHQHVQKKDHDGTSASKEKKETDDSSKTVVRFNVRKTLKNILMDRCKNADDIKMSEEEVRKIAVKIEEALYSLFKDNSFKYRAKYRSLMFNIKDPRNQGLFRKILKGDIPPDRLVRMSPEELASMELAKWREQENQHLLDMIKRGQLEQLNTSCHLKKTHKGEVEIEDDFTNIIDEIPKATSKSLSAEVNEAEKSELDNVVVKDTTHLHRSHLFDLNCKICTGKIIPPPVEDSAPKKVRVAHSISVDMSSPNVADAIEKTLSKIVDGDDSLDQEPTSTVSIGSPDVSLKLSKENEATVKAVWKGFIFMQDVAKFVTSAYKVSGQTDSLSVDVPDTIQVCGRIIPDQVWDYLGKIKQSGSKELIIVRFQAANDEEAITYNSFYTYLSSRKRYGVVSNYSKKIKDFYILPLAATSPVPIVLMPFDGPGLPSPRPHLLLGVIVRHRVKQINSATSKKEKNKDDIDRMDGSYTPPLDNRSYTPPLPAVSNDSSLNISSDGAYSPSMEFKSVNEEAEVTHSTSSIDNSTKNSAVYEPSFTPPLQIISSEYQKEKDEDKPYDPEQDIQNMETDGKETGLNPKQNVPSTENLEKHKKILDALTRQVEETDRQVNALKQLISHPDDPEADASSAQQLDINSVTAAGMSSFLDIPENLQDILNVVRERSLDKEKSSNEKCDVDMRVGEFCKSLNNSENILNVPEKSCVREGTPLPDENNKDTASISRPSDPRIKLKTNFSESSFSSEEPPNVSLSNMSVSELVERAEKELAEIEALESVHKGSSVSQEKSSNLCKLSSWNQFKEPPPPGIEPTELCTEDGSFPPQTAAAVSVSDKSLSSSFAPLIQDAQQISSHFPPPPFQSHLPPEFSVQAPPPSIKGFPPPNVISTAYPPPLPIVSKSSDESWQSWNVPQQSKDNTWQDKNASQWNETWKHRSDKTSSDHPESSSHYYPSGNQEFKKEQFYRNKPTSNSRWNQPSSRFGRSNWNKRGRGSHWRGRKPFHSNKSQRN